MKHELNVVLSPRVGGKNASPCAGARVLDCSDCGHAVWVSPSSQERLGSGGWKLLCNFCGAKVLEQSTTGDKFTASNSHTEEQVTCTLNEHKIQKLAEKMRDL